MRIRCDRCGNLVHEEHILEDRYGAEICPECWDIEDEWELGHYDD